MAKRKRKATRRARGTGTIFYSRSRRAWIGRIPCGKTPGGFTRYQEISDPSQRDLVERLKLLRPPGPETTVAQWAAHWLGSLSVRDSTRYFYSHTVRRFIVPTLGHVRVAELTTLQCESAIRQWSKRVSPGTLRVYLGQLRNLLNAARRAGLCLANPAADLRTAKPRRRINSALSATDLFRIIAEALRRPSGWPIALLAATGCRVGEALALDIPDWNPTAGTVTISKTWTRQHGTRPPKSEQGFRTIRVPDAARPALMAAAGNRRSGPLFTVWNGRNRRYHESVRTAFAFILKRLAIPRVNLHGLRHAVISNMIAGGVPLADTAAYAGDVVSTIVATYLHSTGKDPSLVMDQLLFTERASKSRVGQPAG